MDKQIDQSKGPGVYIPPPLFYVLIFFVAIGLQKIIPMSNHFLGTKILKWVGVLCFVTAFVFLFRSLRQFFRTKNTVILIKRASSLQTSGIYAITRNPMYVGLAIVYLGVTCFIGNSWHLILFPLLILIVQEYIIRREERYLSVEFGQEYETYKRKVRRWL